MAFEVHTPLGLGTVTETDQVRGRTSYKVAGRGFDKWFDETEITKTAWAPVDHDNSVALPYDPTPQYPAIPGDVESTLQPIHGIDADERLSPADSITFDHRGDDESDLQVSDNFLTAAWDPTRGPEPDQDVQHEHWMGLHAGPEGDSWEHESPYYSGGDGPSQDYQDHHGVDSWLPQDQEPYHPSQAYEFENRGPEDIYSDVPGHMANVHEGFAFLIPLAEGLAGAAGGSAAAGAAEGAGMGALGQGVARGVGSAGVHGLMGGDDGSGAPPADGGDPAAGGEGGGEEQQTSVLDRTGPGTGWGPLISHGSAIDQYLAAQERRAQNTGAGLSDKYIDLTASADFHNDPVAQFRHDPIAFIERTAHVEYEPVSPEMEHYGQLVEANPNIREAAWADVRAKAMRLRREGRIDVKDVAPDRIYASVEGDHGTYDVMIAKEGAFGGFGGGHAISNWRCACEWGRWAFQRRLTYVGRLCSHGYATYMEMQSQHTKGQERLPKQHRYKKRADALQNEPQRLVPELVVNDTDDAHQFQHGIDVTKDERDDTGPDDIVSDQDIVHFARVMGYCDRHQLPYPRELTAFLVRHADDENPEDWRVEDAAKAEGALNEIRDWSNTSIEEDRGHLEQRNDDVRDAIDEAREKGTDASLFTAGVGFRTAAPESNGDWNVTQDGGRTVYRQNGGNEGYVRDGDTFYPADFQGNGTQGPEGNRYNIGETGYSQSQDGDDTLYRTTNDTGFQVGPGGETNKVNFNGTGERGDGQRYDNDNAGSSPEFDNFLRTAPGLSGGGQNAAPPAGGTPGGSGERSTEQRQIDRTAPGNSTSRNINDEVSSAGGKGANPALDSAADSYNKDNPTPSDSKGNAGPGGIGQGEYTIKPGDTLSDIAQRSGYGDNYQALGDQNGISNYDLINAGGTLNIGKPGDPAKGGGDNKGGGDSTPKADNGQLNQNSGAPGADDAPGGAAATPPPAATPPAATALSTPPAGGVDLGATGTQSGSGSGGVETGAATQTSTPASPGTGQDSANQSAANAQQTPSQDSSTAGGGAADFSSQVQSGLDTFNNAMDTVKSVVGSVFTDQDDYNEWHRFAYPDSTKSYNHTPFNGSGGDVSIEFGTSEEYADKARKEMDDVWDLEHHNVNETDERFREGALGVKRLGGGRRRPPVVPEVIREQRIGGARQASVHEAMESFASFDPLAARRPEDFDDDAQAVHMAAQGGDIVAEFQARNAHVMGNGGGGGGGRYDDFASSPAVQAALIRTAGRNYSLAEQHDLIREGDIGGAGNLSSLDLRGTHYEDDGVGLFT